MGQVHHGSVTTIAAVGRAMQPGQASPKAPGKRYGINQKILARWKKRTSTADRNTNGPPA